MSTLRPEKRRRIAARRSNAENLPNKQLAQVTVTPTKQISSTRNAPDVEATARKSRRRAEQQQLHASATSQTDLSGMTSRVGYMRLLSSRGIQATQERMRREDEAKRQVNSKLLRYDVPGVLELVRPLDTQKRELADAISTHAASSMESLMRRGRKGARQDRVDIESSDSTIWEALKRADVVGKRARKPACLAKSKASFTKALNGHFDDLRPWIDTGATSQTRGYNERAMYSWIQHFHLYVAHYVRRYLHDSVSQKAQNSSSRHQRVVLPYARTDTKAKDSDDSMRADMALVCRPVSNAAEMVVGDMRYNEVFAIVEAKTGSVDLSAASTSRKRKLAPSSTELDEGGGDDVTAAVPPLSADQGDTSNPSTDGINIHAPTSYYFSKAYVVADRLFGPHTRCYPATSTKPAVPVSSRNPICPEVLVKDAWSFVRRNGSSDGSGERGEIAFLKDIKEMLASNPELNDHLPKIICGGTVHMDSNGEAIADNADFILGELHSLLYEDEDTRGHFYSHTRMAMTPIGARGCS
ncbi:hypothetical protein COEREDRAFT_95243 [Coemansia reversa NRRL 1564]|uniref:Uncharacterized protein n=1 Tax=Coemansia reversa (strain ATCC 12441 / NRRL 1564) TaxID=763665 RepID=A0A2G5BLB6_COERN|nr:hypothetical protein COEREDRAFT_95243 [Coemansia reversa NRRL 1564]|eukprot:PIA19762.1 hypothetical protein COEREDRAFT_95243 [Coemansia reversa NRRL 1564]